MPALSTLPVPGQLFQDSQDARLNGQDGSSLGGSIGDEDQLSRDLPRTIISDDVTNIELQRLRQGSLFGNPNMKKYKIDQRKLGLA